jgi:hypothetical protein
LFLKCRTVVLNRSVSIKKQLGQLFDIGLETKPSTFAKMEHSLNVLEFGQTQRDIN